VRVFETPITGGNVSLYNETLGEGIYPSPVLGIIGLMKTAIPAPVQFPERRRAHPFAGRPARESCDPLWQQRIREGHPQATLGASAAAPIWPTKSACTIVSGRFWRRALLNRRTISAMAASGLRSANVAPARSALALRSPGGTPRIRAFRRGLVTYSGDNTRPGPNPRNCLAI